jgi:hypothetical protein
LASVDRFFAKGNVHLPCDRIGCILGAVSRLGRMAYRIREELGLLSDRVGLLQSCIEYQEVIKFLR